MDDDALPDKPVATDGSAMHSTRAPRPNDVGTNADILNR